MGQKIQIGISCTNVERKMKIKNKRYFDINYSFMKSFSQNFEVLTQRGDIINPKLARKRTQAQIPCINGDKKMKIKSKSNFEVRHSFMKLNLEILAPCFDVIISNWVKKTQICTWLKSGTIITLIRKNHSYWIWSFYYSWNILNKSGLFFASILTLWRHKYC